VSVNKYLDHVVVIPEDDADRQLANGFLLHLSLNSKSIDVRRSAGGWKKVLDIDFLDLPSLPRRHLILLIDFDGCFERRKEYFDGQIPDQIRDRVYLIGCLHEPEILKKDCGMGFEAIGESLAESCWKQENGLWDHAELVHNRGELERLMRNVRPILFS